MQLLRHGQLDYAVRMPNHFREDGQYPLVFYLHGAGGRGRDVSVILNNSFFEVAERCFAEAVTVIPQCYADSWFDIFEQLQDFIKSQIDNSSQSSGKSQQSGTCHEQNQSPDL